MTTTTRTSTATIVLLVLGALVVLPLLTMGGGMMGVGGFGMLGGGMFLWPLVLIGLVLLLVYGVGNRDRGDDTGQVQAIETLRERYARGELTDDEYNDRLRTLRNEQQGS
jgi:putative membrane protein